MNTIKLLTVKSVKVLTRKKQIRDLSLASSILIFGLLFVMWYLSRHQKLRFMTSDQYTKLKFDVNCSVDESFTDRRLKCEPDTYAPDRSSRSLTPSELLFSELNNGFLLTNQYDASQLATLLSSVMMNGLPLLGLDDFIYFSDFIGKEIGQKTRDILLTSPGYKDRFGNFLEARKKRILIYPDTCLTRMFVSHMNNKTDTFRLLSSRIYPSRTQALRHCCRNVWALVEIRVPVMGHSGAITYGDKDNCEYFKGSNASNPSINNDESRFTTAGKATAEVANPEVTIRMHPAAVPDTRNYEYSPLNRHLLSRQESGQLLYFTSGFLTIQMEIQNFLSRIGLGGPAIQSKVFTGSNRDSLLRPALVAHSLAAGLVKAHSRGEVYEAVLNASKVQAGVRPNLAFPIFHRAFPTHNNEQSLFWHTFGALTTIGLIVYFSLPAAIISGELSREKTGGQLDVLATLPCVRYLHSLTAWCICGALWSLCLGLLATAFFFIVLQHSTVMLPALALLLLGLSLCPIGTIICMATRSTDTVVVAVPTLVFIMLLPGLLYYELAYDIQRSFFGEMALCLLPASAAALILRTVCGYEAINAGATWFTKAPISDSPMYAYLIMLLFDVVLYSVLAGLLAKGYDTAQRVEPTAEVAPSVCTTFCWTVQDTLSKVLLAIFGEYQYDVDPHNRDIELAEGFSQRSRSRSNNIEADLVEPALIVRSLTKTYSSGGLDIVVLSDINANLPKQSITLLLGSNGAGKTTLMKLLVGLDEDYLGLIRITEDPELCRRKVGWCPQNEALFEQLTVREHIQLISSLEADCLNTAFLDFSEFIAIKWLCRLSECFYNSIGRSSEQQRYSQGNDDIRYQQEEQLVQSLSRLDMLPHCNKQANQLSGGMKRRLSLCLAFLGDPSVILLDEPTSGCDAWTRELVRKDILSRRGSCAILISTHHADDVDVLADRVWFLSERFLVVDEVVENLAAWRSSELQRRVVSSGNSSSSLVSGISNPGISITPLSHGAATGGGGVEQEQVKEEYGAHAMEFSTFDAFIKELFISTMGRRRARSWESGTGDTSVAAAHLDESHYERQESVFCSTWIVPVDYLHLLRQLIGELDREGRTRWSATTCSTYSTLCHLYDQDGVSGRSDRSGSGNGSTLPTSLQPTPTLSHRPMPALFRHIYAIVWMRLLEWKNSAFTFLIAQVLLPFLVVFGVTWGCGDVLYPQTEITSRNVDGVGEMCVSEGSKARNIVHTNTSVFETVYDISALQDISTQPDDAELGVGVGVGVDSSSGWNDSAPSALAVAMQEQFGVSHVNWVGGIGSDMMLKHLFDSYYSHQKARWAAFVAEDEVKQWLQGTVVVSEKAIQVNISELYSAIRQAQHEICNQSGLFSDDSDIRESTFCGSIPALRIAINNSTDLTLSEKSISITSFESFRANVTMLSNVTTDHAAPTYLKEVVPVVFSALQRTSSDPSYNATGQVLAAQYRLYSHPLPLANRSNEVYMQRGYLGSTMVVLYTLITTITCVRSVIKQRKNGTKSQLHLASVSPATFWLGNLLFDASLCGVTFFTIFSAIFLGGAPIKSYFLDFFPFPGALLGLCMVTYSLAAVASSYALVVLTEDPLPAQMGLLISSICSGMFLKMYLDRHMQDSLYSTIAWTLQHTSPAFTFSTAMFNLIAMHVLNVSAAAQGKAGPDEAHLLHSIYHCVTMMIGQTLIYLIIAIIIDTYYLRISSSWQTKPTSRHCADEDRSRFSYNNSKKTRCASNNSSNNCGARSVEEGRGLLLSVPDDPTESLLLQADNITVNYPGQCKRALDHATFNMAGGDRVALMGMNGGGKSTLFRTLALAHSPLSEGSLYIKGMNVIYSSWQIRQEGLFGYVPQEGGLYEFLTVDQTLQLFTMIRPRRSTTPSTTGRNNDALSETVIPGRYLGYAVNTLSGGTRKKLAVRVANTGNPSLLLLDECTTGVDPIAADQIIQYLRITVRQATQSVLFASHRMDESIAVCGRALMLAKGKVFLDVPISYFHDLANKYFQVDIYLQRMQLNDAPAANAERVCAYGSFSTTSGMKMRMRGVMMMTMPELLEELENTILCQSEGESEREPPYRIVVYSTCLVRVTWEKNKVPISSLWDLLAGWQGTGRILRYAFRSMGLEEVMGEMFETTKRNWGGETESQH